MIRFILTEKDKATGQEKKRVSGARVVLTDKNGKTYQATETLGSDGKAVYEASVPILTKSKYTLSVSHPDYRGIKNDQFAVTKTATHTLTMNAGDLSGTVRNQQTSLPIEDVTVTAVHMGSGKNYTCQTDQNGNFLFEYIDEGDYTLHFVKHRYPIEDYLETEETIAVERDTVNALLDIVRMTPTGGLSGNVIDRDSRNDLLGVHVTMSGPNGEYLGISDIGGAFGIRDVILGRYTVTFTLEGYEPVEKTLVVAKPTIAASMINVEMRKTTVEEAIVTIHGTVYEQYTGNRLENVSVTAYGSGSAVFTARTDASGKYVINDAPTGDYILVFRLAGYEEEKKTVVASSVSVTAAVEDTYMKCRDSLLVTGTLINEWEHKNGNGLTVELYYGGPENKKDAQWPDNVEGVPTNGAVGNGTLLDSTVSDDDGKFTLHLPKSIVANCDKLSIRIIKRSGAKIAVITKTRKELEKKNYNFGRLSLLYVE